MSEIETEVPLAPLTTFGVGGPAEMLARPGTPEEAADLVALALAEGKELRVLGAGSNVLVSDEGVRGTVLLMTAPPFKHLARAGDRMIQAGAGARLLRVVNAAADWGLAGAEPLVGIPGTLAGALRMNAGTRDGEIGPLVGRVWTVDREGKPETLAGAECGFGYRSSALRDRVILGAEFELSRGGSAGIRSRMESLAARRKETQPHGVRTAGSVFRNPAGTAAGRLLDELGLRGLARGGARVSPVHANFIESGGGATPRPGGTAADIKWLIDEMRRRAREERGVELELEIELWGFGERGGS